MVAPQSFETSRRRLIGTPQQDIQEGTSLGGGVEGGEINMAKGRRGGEDQSDTPRATISVVRNAVCCRALQSVVAVCCIVLLQCVAECCYRVL